MKSIAYKKLEGRVLSQISIFRVCHFLAEGHWNRLFGDD